MERPAHVARGHRADTDRGDQRADPGAVDAGHVQAALRHRAGRRYVVLDTGSSDGERYSPSPVRKLLALASIVVMTACGARATPAQTPQWQTIGELAQPRAYASAIALSSGKILVVGGFDRFAPD